MPRRLPSTAHVIVGLISLLAFEVLFVGIALDALSSGVTKAVSLALFPLGAAIALNRRSMIRVPPPDDPGPTGVGSKLQVLSLLGGGIGVVIGSAIDDHVAPAVMIPITQLAFGFGITVLVLSLHARRSGAQQDASHPGCEFCREARNRDTHLDQIADKPDSSDLLLLCPQCGQLWDCAPYGRPPEAIPDAEALRRFPEPWGDDRDANRG